MLEFDASEQLSLNFTANKTASSPAIHQNTRLSKDLPDYLCKNNLDNAKNCEVTTIEFPDFNASDICSNYLSSLQEKQRVNDTRNAIVRYFVPSVGGPTPSAQKRRPISQQEIDAAFIFLREVSLDQLNDAPNLALITLARLESAPAQKERVRRNLRELIDWARRHQFLPAPHNPIPEGICEGITVGQFKGINLIPATVRQIFERYIEQLETNHTDRINLQNAIVRFLVPGCSGPIPYHKPATAEEIAAGLTYLETIPLEYLYHASFIATAAAEAFGLTLSHGTLIRHNLQNLICWAQAENYLPYPEDIKPWSQTEAEVQLLAQDSLKHQQTAYEFYESYCQHLTTEGKTSEIQPLLSAVIRSFVPHCGGPTSSHKRSTVPEVQAGMDFLKEISATSLHDLITTFEDDLRNSSKNFKAYYSSLSRLKRWINWDATSCPMSRNLRSERENQVVFNTFRKPNSHYKKIKHVKTNLKHSTVFALNAKCFPNDYINNYLQKQINEYEQWRLANSIAPGSIPSEKAQILQFLGWLHRYEHVPLESLCFEEMITKSKLSFNISDYADYDTYLYDKEQGGQKARDKAKEDYQRVIRYLVFLNGHPKSESRRLYILISVAKFLYRDLIGTDEFPDTHDIPILRRLSTHRATVDRKSKITPQTISFHEASTTWEELITVMEQERQRTERVILYTKNKSSKKGYHSSRRGDRAIAEDLQNFLSIAFSIVIPSRSRTFYDLEIGKTLKEGILQKNGLLTVQTLQKKGLWEEMRSSVRFYIHHKVEDYKTGKAMPLALIENDGWWAEVPNLSFGDRTLYDYIYRWLQWGREVNGAVNHPFFFRRFNGTAKIDGHAWSNRIKAITHRWTGVAIPPKNIRKMFATQFPEHSKSAAMLLQHSETIHQTVYDVRLSTEQMRPVMDANEKFISEVLKKNDKNG